MNANELEAMQLCRDAQMYPGEAQHSDSAETVYVIFENGKYTVYDNGEGESTADTYEAVKMIVSDIEAAQKLHAE